MEGASVLVVEDRDSLRRMLVRALREEGYQVEAVADGDAGRERAENGRFDLVLTDLKLPGSSGLEVLAASRRRHPATPVVVLTAYGTVAAAVEAMKLGAADFLEKPVELDELFELVASLVGGATSIESRWEVPGGPVIVGSHPRFAAALRLLRKVAVTEATVLLTGESGTGKELFARALHGLSPRRDGPFVTVNCAAIPGALMENELFGHEKGAFTGAHRRQAGRFEQAAGGTLFLDEIGELEPGVQGKVLRVLEERTFERVGGGVTQHADVRLVAATNRDLGQMVEEGSFRSDLFFRLDVFPIHLPPLRERASDIVPLARHVLERLAERHGTPLPELTAGAWSFLAEQPWPGNVRELSNLLERASIVHAGVAVDAATLSGLRAPVTGEEERDRLRRALKETEGNKREAARRLGISYRTLQRKVRDLDLEGYPRYRR